MAKSINRKVTIYINGKEVENTIKSLRGELKKLENEQKNLTIGSQEYIETSKKIAEIRGVLREQSDNVNNLGSSWKDAAEKLASYSNILMGVQSAFEMLDIGIGKLKDLSKDAAALDDVYADVMKTTGLTHEQVEKLNESFKKMDTRTSREQLNQLAYEAGKLGINSEEAVLQFVSASDKINIALGDVLGDGAMVTIGKLADVYGKSTQQLADAGDNLEKKMLSIGSAINLLGQSSTANEGYMVEFLSRMGGIATQANLSADAILGFASALDQDMMKQEMSATAFQKFIMQMIKSPAKFAASARMEVSEFADLMQKDMNEALLKVLEGFQGQGGLISLQPIFEDLGLDAARAASVISSMANSIDQIREAQAIANSELTTGSSVMNEFNTKNETMQAKAEKAKKAFEDMRIELGNELYPVLIHLQKSGTALMNGFAGVVQVCKENKAILPGLIALALNYTRVQIATRISSVNLIATAKSLLGVNKLQAMQTSINTAREAKATAAKEASRLATIKQQLATNKKIIADKAEYVAMGANNVVYAAERNAKTLSVALTKQMTVATEANTAAQTAQKAVFSSTPWGLVITAVTALAAGMVKLVKHANRFNKEAQETNRAIGEETSNAKYLFDRLEDCTKGTEEYKNALEKLNEAYPEIISKYRSESGELLNVAAARQEVINKIREQVVEQRKLDKLSGISGDFAEKQEKALQKMQKYMTRRFGEKKGQQMFADFSEQLPQDYNSKADYASLRKIYEDLSGEDMGDMFGWNQMLHALGDYTNAIDEAYEETKRFEELYTGFGAKNKSGNTGGGTSSSSSAGTGLSEGADLPSGNSDPKAAAEAAKKWAEVKVRVDKMVSESAVKTESGLAKVNSEITMKFDQMRNEVKEAAKEAGVSSDEEIGKLDRAEEKLKKAKIDEYVTKMREEYEKMSTKVKSTNLDENIAKVENAASQLNQELSNIDSVIASLSEDSKNATDDNKQEIEQLITKYKKLKSELTNSTFANLFGDVSAKPISQRSRDGWSKETKSKVDGMSGLYDKSTLESYGNALEEINKKYDEQRNNLTSISSAEDVVISELQKKLDLETDPEEQDRLRASIADHQQRKEAIDGEVEKLDKFKKEAEEIAEEDAFGTAIDRWIQGIDKFANTALDIFSNINQLLDNLGERELKEQEERRDSGIEALDEQLEQGLVSQESYDEQKEELEEEYDEKEKEIKLEQWKRNKALSISQATIDGALAVMKTYKEYGWTPVGIALAAAAGVAAGIQIATIAAEPAPYAKGGYVNGKQYIMAGEAGREWVASNRLLDDPATAPMISALEQYQRGNRRALTDVSMAAIDMPLATEAAKELGRRQTSIQQPLTAAASQQHVAQMAADNNEMVAVMKQLAIYLSDPNNRRAVISRQTMTDFDNNENFLRNKARL